MEGINPYTVIISLLALVVSAFTAYRNFFSSSIELLYFINYTGAFPKENHKYDPYVDLVISNTGNRPGIIISLALYFVKDEQECNQNRKPETNWKKYLVDDKEITATAFVIKGQDSVTKRVVFSEYDLRDAFSQGAPEVPEVIRYACLELGTLDKQHKEIWKTVRLGELGFQVDRSHPWTDHRYVEGTLHPKMPWLGRFRPR